MTWFGLTATTRDHRATERSQPATQRLLLRAVWQSLRFPFHPDAALHCPPASLSRHIPHRHHISKTTHTFTQTPEPNTGGRARMRKSRMCLATAKRSWIHDLIRRLLLRQVRAMGVNSSCYGISNTHSGHMQHPLAHTRTSVHTPRPPKRHFSQSGRDHGSMIQPIMDP